MSVKLDLTDEERRALVLFIQAALVEPKYPLSPEVEALRRVAEKLERAEGLPAGSLAKLPLDSDLLRLDEFDGLCAEITRDSLPMLLRFGLKLLREDDHEGSGYKAPPERGECVMQLRQRGVRAWVPLTSGSPREAAV